MAEEVKPLYEGLFLLSLQTAEIEGAKGIDFVKEVLSRADAEVVTLRRWDERRLAYPIKGQKRGVYFLTYFRAEGSAIAHIERDCNLSEQVLRVMMLRADHVGETELDLEKQEVETSATAAKMQADEAPAAEATKTPEPAAAGAE